MERRHDKRFGNAGVIESFNFHATNQQVAINSPVEISLVDISMGGLGIKSNVKIDLETTLSIDLQLEDQNYVVVGQVIWCKNEGSLYNCGMKLIYLPEELKEFIAENLDQFNKYTN